MVRHASLFSQLIAFFDRNKFKKLVIKHQAEKYSKGFQSWDQFVSMLFCQVAQAKSLREISVPPRRINEIVHGKRSITADTALRLGHFFGMSPEFWLNLQTRYDLEVTEDFLAGRLDDEVHALHAQTG